MPNDTAAHTPETKPKKKSTVRHTRAIQRDRSKRPVSMPTGEAVATRLTELVHPLTLAQVQLFHAMGLRERILTLPVMMALVLSMIWRQVGSIQTLTRLVQEEALLWAQPQPQLTAKAMESRLRTLPAELFWRVLSDLLPLLQARWAARQRPLSPALAWARPRYTEVVACDGSTLDALLRKVGVLAETVATPLAGRMLALLDLCSHLPRHIWYEPDAEAHDQRFWPQLLPALRTGSLLIFDLGFTNFAVFAQLTQAEVTFITRAKSNLAYQVERSCLRTATVRDELVWIGSGEPRQRVRLVQVFYENRWYRYLTNELDATRLPVAYLVALYWQRWRIEDAYNTSKRLLGLAYFWSGAQNAVEMQLAATWILYAVLVDLTDAVAEVLNKRFAALSLEMVYRSLPYFTQAYYQDHTTEVVAFLAKHAERYGILKRQRKRDQPSVLMTLMDLTSAANP
jgi:hypothetical protein